MGRPPNTIWLKWCRRPWTRGGGSPWLPSSSPTRYRSATLHCLGGMLLQSASTAAAAPAARIGRIFCMGKILTTTFSARR